MRFRPIFLAVIFVTCAMWMQTQAKAQSADVQSVAEFLAICRSHQRACVFYLSGMLDGVTMAEELNHIPTRYCTRGASYFEISNAYLAFLASEQVKGNAAILSQPNAVIFLNLFMDGRYRCRA